MSFEPTKVIEMNKGKQIGDTLMQDASTIPYNNTNVKDELDTINSNLSNIKEIIYPIGCIIESTTCSSLALVKQTYGGNNWIQHSGYVLRGATSGVTANSATKTGGSDNAIVVSHSHSINDQTISVSGANHRHTSSSYGPSSIAGEGYNAAYVSSTTPSLNNIRSTSLNTSYSGALSMSGTLAAHNTNNEGSSGINANIPNYKSVYIWERIS